MLSIADWMVYYAYKERAKCDCEGAQRVEFEKSVMGQRSLGTKKIF